MIYRRFYDLSRRVEEEEEEEEEEEGEEEEEEEELTLRQQLDLLPVAQQKALQKAIEERFRKI